MHEQDHDSFVKRPLPGEHFVAVSDGLECFGRILDAEAPGEGCFPHFCQVLCTTIGGIRGTGGLGFPKTEEPSVGMLGASCAAGGFGCAAWHFPDNSTIIYHTTQ